MDYRQPFTGEYPITQIFGEYIPGVTVGTKHTGIDYACPEGTPILASADGQVMYAGWSPYGWGNMVIIRHNDGKATVYAHLDKVTVRANQPVKQSERIGLSGSTGNSTGPHLHFEARQNWSVAESCKDPVTFLPLKTFADAAPKQQSSLKAADELGESVEIVAPRGAWGWAADFTSRQTVYPCGTRLRFTGRTTQRLGYTYCEVYPEPVTYWVAVNDGETQILDNTE